MRATKAIFERAGADGEDTFFDSRAQASAKNHVIAEFANMPPNIARSMKESMKAALVIVPTAPYYAKGKVSWGEPTIQNPQDIDETLEVVLADIQCALLTDEENKVYTAIQAR